MNLAIVSKEMFGQNEMNIYQNENNEIFMTREQIGEELEYTDPRHAIRKIHSKNNESIKTTKQIGQAIEYTKPRHAIRKIQSRNKERLNKFSVGTKLTSTDGKRYKTIIYNEQGIYEIIRKSGQPKADEFYDWVYDLLSKLRKGELQVDKPNNTKLLLKT